MSRSINTGDLNNRLQACTEFGMFRTQIINVIESMIADCPTTETKTHSDTIKAVLEIIDGNLPHGVIWQEDEWQVGWHDGVTKIRNEVLALKGGEKE